MSIVFQRLSPDAVLGATVTEEKVIDYDDLVAAASSPALSGADCQQRANTTPPRDLSPPFQEGQTMYGPTSPTYDVDMECTQQSSQCSGYNAATPPRDGSVSPALLEGHDPCDPQYQRIADDASDTESVRKEFDELNNLPDNETNTTKRNKRKVPLYVRIPVGKLNDAMSHEYIGLAKSGGFRDATCTSKISTELLNHEKRSLMHGTYIYKVSEDDCITIGPEDPTPQLCFRSGQRKWPNTKRKNGDSAPAAQESVTQSALAVQIKTAAPALPNNSQELTEYAREIGMFRQAVTHEGQGWTHTTDGPDPITITATLVDRFVDGEVDGANVVFSSPQHKVTWTVPFDRPIKSNATTCIQNFCYFVAAFTTTPPQNAHAISGQLYFFLQAGMRYPELKFELLQSLWAKPYGAEIKGSKATHKKKVEVLIKKEDPLNDAERTDLSLLLKAIIFGGSVIGKAAYATDMWGKKEQDCRVAEAKNAEYKLIVRKLKDTIKKLEDELAEQVKEAEKREKEADRYDNQIKEATKELRAFAADADEHLDDNDIAVQVLEKQEQITNLRNAKAAAESAAIAINLTVRKSRRLLAKRKAEAEAAAAGDADAPRSKRARKH